MTKEYEGVLCVGVRRGGDGIIFYNLVMVVITSTHMLVKNHRILPKQVNFTVGKSYPNAPDKITI